MKTFTYLCVNKQRKKDMKKLNPLPKREEPKRIPIGSMLSMNYRGELHETIIAYAWKLWHKINGDAEPNWDYYAVRVSYREHNLVPFSVKAFVEGNEYETLTIMGIGFDVDNVFFIDDDDDWVEVAEMSTDELFDALNNIEFNLDKVSNNA